MAKTTITIGMPLEVWERARDIVGKEKSNSDIGRTVFEQWLAWKETGQDHLLKAYARPETMARDLKLGQQTNAGPRQPQVLKWERGG